MHKEKYNADNLLFELLRFALDESSGFASHPDREEWETLYAQAVSQALVGLLFNGVNRLRGEQVPPFELLMTWAGAADEVRSRNRRANSTARRLTALFEREGHQTLILKGQANALLYDDPACRQPGDIDIYVDGGQEAVRCLLRRLNMTVGEGSSNCHYRLAETPEGVEVEVHFRYAHGSGSSRLDRRLTDYLRSTLAQGAPLSAEGFRTPPLSFALAMQLSHIQQHVLGSGIGLRQLTDYYMLLRRASEEERALMRRNVERLGLQYVGGALMWIMQEKLRLPEEWLIARPDARRGAWMLQRTMTGGNFGQYAPKDRDGARMVRFMRGRMAIARRLWMCPSEARGTLSEEGALWLHLARTIPERMKAGRVFLGEW